MTMKEFKNELREYMVAYLEDMCGYLAIGQKNLFRYYAGKADAIREILEQNFQWEVESETEHVKNMFDIMDENW